jgi:hypothetical protein
MSESVIPKSWMETKENLERELDSSPDEVLSRVYTWAAKIEAALEINRPSG